MTPLTGLGPSQSINFAMHTPSLLERVVSFVANLFIYIGEVAMAHPYLAILFTAMGAVIIFKKFYQPQTHDTEEPRSYPLQDFSSDIPVLPIPVSPPSQPWFGQRIVNFFGPFIPSGRGYVRRSHVPPPDHGDRELPYQQVSFSRTNRFQRGHVPPLYTPPRPPSQEAQTSFTCSSSYSQSHQPQGSGSSSSSQPKIVSPPDRKDRATRCPQQQLPTPVATPPQPSPQKSRHEKQNKIPNDSSSLFGTSQSQRVGSSFSQRPQVNPPSRGGRDPSALLLSTGSDPFSSPSALPNASSQSNLSQPSFRPQTGVPSRSDR